MSTETPISRTKMVCGLMVDSVYAITGRQGAVNRATPRRTEERGASIGRRIRRQLALMFSIGVLMGK